MGPKYGLYSTKFFQQTPIYLLYGTSTSTTNKIFETHSNPSTYNSKLFAHLYLAAWFINHIFSNLWTQIQSWYVPSPTFPAPHTFPAHTRFKVVCRIQIQTHVTPKWAKIHEAMIVAPGWKITSITIWVINIYWTDILHK